MKYFIRIILLFTLIYVASCAQKPAEIVYKGHLYFTKGKFYNKSNFVPPVKKRKKVHSSPNQLVVQAGDTVYSLARANKVSIRSLIEHNDLAPPYIIYPGNTLNISNRRTHVVKSGENLTKLSLLYGVSLTELANINNFSRTYKIKTGEILLLPYDATISGGQANNMIATGSSKKSAVKRSVRLPSHVSFVWPVSKGKIITKFGPKANGVHNDGVNIKADFGTPIKSVAEGKVVYVGSELRGYGNLVIIKHPNNWLTAYAHNDETYVAKNQKVIKGEVIATVGSTGNVKTPQLHFGLRKGRKAVNPEKYIKQSS